MEHLESFPEIFSDESHWMNSLVKGRYQPVSPSSRSVAARLLLSYIMKNFSANVDHGSRINKVDDGQKQLDRVPRLVGLTTTFSLSSR